MLWFLYSLTNFVFCRSSNYLYSPFSRLMKAFASWAAWPCIRKFLLCSVSFIYFANFSFSFSLCLIFSYYFFLYSIIDLALASSIFLFYSSAYFFFFNLSAYFWRASSSLAAIILFFLLLMVSLNSYFFFKLEDLLCSSSFFLSDLTSSNLFLSCYKFISSRRPMLTY